jgi:D-galacturonate reductase
MNLGLFPKPSNVQRQITKVTIDDINATQITGSNESKVNVLMIGTGEYTTGFVNNKPSESDKSAGVVALVMFDLRARNKIGKLGLCGVNGTKFPKIRQHFDNAISSVYKNLDIDVDTFPLDDTIDPFAYIKALDSYKKGDAVIIFTPDDTHFTIAMEAIKRGLHVLITKPVVKTLSEHKQLHEAALLHNTIVAIEVHKRWDPMYIDAKDKIANLGSFSYLYSYMSQPKHQLETFKAWAGKSSDISYYLNSHHIDFHEWIIGENSRPTRVTALASTGVASNLYEIQDCEDTITLAVQWENIQMNDSLEDFNFATSQYKVTSVGTAVYTSSWIAPKSDVHSQQRFFYMGQVKFYFFIVIFLPCLLLFLRRGRQKIIKKLIKKQ